MGDELRGESLVHLNVRFSTETELKAIQDMLGHVDVSTTMNIYVDAMNDMKKKEMAAYSKYITKPEDVDNMTVADLNRITMMKMGFINP